MKFRNQLLTAGFIALLTMLLLNSCSTTLNIADLQQNAETAYEAGDYATALQHYESLIKKWNENQAFEENPYYDKAGKAAFAMKDYNKAIEYFNHSMHYGFADKQTYLVLTEYYHEAQNFSREMTLLNALIEKFPEVAVETGAHERLLEMYVETSRWEEAAAQIPYISREPDIRLLEKMLLIHSKLDNEQEAEKIAGQLLKLDRDNVAALEQKAINYFEAGEARYNAETEAYERNKTRSQYARLLRGYEAAGEDYRKARDIFERLYKENPERRYAVYLYNIYARFQDEEKAAYYRKRL